MVSVQPRLTKLFEPITIGKMEVRNRLAMSPLEIHYTAERLANFYTERAKGGVGLIICALRPFIQRRDYKPDLQLLRLIGNCHAYGAKLAGQVGLGLALWREVGSELEALESGGTGRSGRVDVLGPSGIFFAERRGHPRAMTLEEIDKFIEEKAVEAERIREAGFDAVDIAFHIASILNQFFSPLTNKRTDQYGGSLENRSRLLLQTIAGVRQRVGNDFPIMVRISGSDFMEGGYSLEDVKQLAPMLEKASVNFLTVMYGWHESPVPNFQTSVPRGAWIYLAEAVKRVVNIPVMGGCRMGDPLLAEEVIAQGRVDMVFMARPLIADPELPNKAKEGRLNDIRPCIACTRCFELIAVEFKPMACAVNPLAGKEAELVIRVAPKPKKVVIIGGGPAGMQAALIAAARGHKVTLYERNHTLGGNLMLAAAPPYKEESKSLMNYLIYQTQKCGAEVKLGEEATPDSILKGDPDAVIVATGATPITPDILGVDKPNVVSALDVLSMPVHTAHKVGYSVVIIGGGLVGCETAEFLERLGRQVTILEMLDRMANDVYRPLRWPLMQRLRKVGIKMETGTRADEITEGGVRAVQGGVLKFFDCDTVVLAVGLKPNDKLAREMEGKVAVYKVGDCVKPQRIFEAIESGTLAAMNI